MGVITVVLVHVSPNALDAANVLDVLDVQQVVQATVLVTAEEHLVKGLAPKAVNLVAKEVAA